ncbi:hypothetical protein CBL_02504 [Carabus blaptoides fortunei]
MLRGDKTYNLMKLTPYTQAQLTLYNKREKGKFIVNTLRLRCLDTINVKSVSLNFDTGKYKGHYYFDKLIFEGTYNIDFKVGVNVTHTFDIVDINQDGYVFLPNPTVKFTATNTIYNLENLCESAEEYLRINYKELNKLFRPNFRRIFSVVMTSPFRALSELIKLQTGVGFGKGSSYLSQCCVSDPDVEKCYLEQAKLCVPLMLSGDKYYNVVSLLPYREAQRVLLNNDDGRCVLNTLRVWGLDSLTVLNVTFALDKEQYVYITHASVKFTASNIAYNLENLSEEGHEYLQLHLDQVHEMFEPKLRSLLAAVLTSPIRSYAELIKLPCAIGYGRNCKKC